MNLSLVAVFISILFMGGIVERLFREFSITLAVAVVISLLVSLTLTPMLCARWLKAEDEQPRGRLQQWGDRLQTRVFGYLRAFAGLGTAPFVADGHQPAGDHRAERLPVRQHSEDLHAAAGHRPTDRFYPR